MGPRMDGSSSSLRSAPGVATRRCVKPTAQLPSLYRNISDVGLKREKFKDLPAYKDQCTKTIRERPRKDQKVPERSDVVLEISTQASILLMLQLPMIHDESAMYSWVEGDVSSVW